MQGEYAKQPKKKPGRPKISMDERALKAGAEVRKMHKESRDEMSKGKKC